MSSDTAVRDSRTNVNIIDTDTKLGSFSSKKKSCLKLTATLLTTGGITATAITTITAVALVALAFITAPTIVMPIVAGAAALTAITATIFLISASIFNLSARKKVTDKNVDSKSVKKIKNLERQIRRLKKQNKQIQQSSNEFANLELDRKGNKDKDIEDLKLQIEILTQRGRDLEAANSQKCERLFEVARNKQQLESELKEAREKIRSNQDHAKSFQKTLSGVEEQLIFEKRRNIEMLEELEKTRKVLGEMERENSLLRDELKKTHIVIEEATSKGKEPITIEFEKNDELDNLKDKIFKDQDMDLEEEGENLNNSVIITTVDEEEVKDTVSV